MAGDDAMSGCIIGVDVGGTFTDVFILNEADGTASVAKVPTTRPDQSDGFLDGIKREVSDLSEISVVVHGTTAGTNALLERKGAKTGVICTQGLRDVHGVCAVILNRLWIAVIVWKCQSVLWQVEPSVRLSI